ncbi:hypothetical protein JTB14_032942 [Gonioctena quinquepunctata]|nr:hypothetical protein JTB14_032942 [Gonioctena quinquepunctata]
MPPRMDQSMNKRRRLPNGPPFRNERREGGPCPHKQLYHHDRARRSGRRRSSQTALFKELEPTRLTGDLNPPPNRLIRTFPITMAIQNSRRKTPRFPKSTSSSWIFPPFIENQQRWQKSTDIRYRSTIVHQSPYPGKAGQRLILEPAPGNGQHVRKKVVTPSPETLQR